MILHSVIWIESEKKKRLPRCVSEWHFGMCHDRIYYLHTNTHTHTLTAIHKQPIHANDGTHVNCVRCSGGKLPTKRLKLWLMLYISPFPSPLSAIFNFICQIEPYSIWSESLILLPFCQLSDGRTVSLVAPTNYVDCHIRYQFFATNRFLFPLFSSENISKFLICWFKSFWHEQKSVLQWK